VLRPPRADNPCHKLALHVGIDVREAEIDLDLRSHAVIPLYAYDAGHPIELLARVGHWKECVIVDRAPGSNQVRVRATPKPQP